MLKQIADVMKSSTPLDPRLLLALILVVRSLNFCKKNTVKSQVKGRLLLLLQHKSHLFFLFLNS